MMTQRRIPVGSLESIPVGRVKHFSYGIRKGIVYNDQGTLRAYINFCTHMGGLTDLAANGRLRCCRHFAEFDPRTGERVLGQAPEGTRLTPIELVVEDGQAYAILEIKTDEFSF